MHPLARLAMEDINTTGSATALIERKLIQPRLIIQALAFTGILYFSVGQKPPHTLGEIRQSASSSVTLSQSVTNSVLQHASHQSGLPASALQIIHAHPHTWSDSCLELHEPTAVCTQIPVSGWHISITAGKQRWSYRTNTSGSVIKIEQKSASPGKNSKEVA
jgi:hypothetical protein